VLNPEKNWYELKYLENEQTPLEVTGYRPYLMINYQAIFSGAGEARVQTEPLDSRPAVSQPVLPPSLAPAGEFPLNSNTTVPPDAGLAQIYEMVPAQPRPPAETGFPREGLDEAGFYGETDFVAGYDPEDWSMGNDYFSNDYFVVDLITGGTPSVPQNTGLASSPASAGSGYVLQVGAFKDRKNAADAYATLEREGFNPHYEDYQNLTRVVVPSVEPKDLANARARIKALGFGEPYVRQ
jgi:hypothetical protein